MGIREVRALLERSVGDAHLGERERALLRDDLAAWGPSAAQLVQLRREAFDMALGRVDGHGQAIVEWLHDVIERLLPRLAAATSTVAGSDTVGAIAEAYFSPQDDCGEVIARRIAAAQQTLDICVFTITDNRLSQAILDAYRQGVAVRVITDNEKAADRGSDTALLERQGINVRVDRSPFHMHHKFALFDGALLLTGSYNWTVGAARGNQENIVLTDDRRLIERYTGAFEQLWLRLG